MANKDPTKPSLANAEDSHATKGLIRLTMACNEKCPFCNVPQEDYSPPTPPEDQTDEELQRFIDRGDKTITISGGEPTLLRKRLIRMVERASAGGIQFIEIQTNAVLIDTEYATALAEAGVTSAFVSLLSHIPEHHDALAGLKDAFPKCVAGIDALLDAGIRVTLNPVTARRTQELVVDFIRFVGERLPRVRSISMSAVQPHGRAHDNIDLLPDYDVLSKQIREGREVAAALGIEIINPYCGLPLCVGWEDGLAVSVEAIEATITTTAQGLNNHGNKSHGLACMDCVLRNRCGGAWHAVWRERGGRGIAPPETIHMPWEEAKGSAQVLFKHMGESTPLDWSAASHSNAPSKWLWTDTPHSSKHIRAAGFGHLVLRMGLHNIEASKPLLTLARRIGQTNEIASPQRNIQVHIEWPIPEETPSESVEYAFSVAAALGARSLTLTGPHAEQFRARVHALPRSVIGGIFSD